MISCIPLWIHNSYRQGDPPSSTGLSEKVLYPAENPPGRFPRSEPIQADDLPAHPSICLGKRTEDRGNNPTLENGKGLRIEV